MGKDQDYLNQAIYDAEDTSLDTIEKPKKIKYDKKNLRYQENIVDKLFKKKKKVKKQENIKKEKELKNLKKTNNKPFDILKKKKKITFFNKL